jgi:preprotein translocase subunit SecA
MINSLLTRVFGSRNERQLRQLNRIVAKVNALEPEIEKLSDEQLKAKTPEFKQRIADGEALDHAEFGDRAADLGVVDGRERSGDRVFDGGGRG